MVALQWVQIMGTSMSFGHLRAEISGIVLCPCASMTVHVDVTSRITPHPPMTGLRAFPCLAECSVYKLEEQHIPLHEMDVIPGDVLEHYFPILRPIGSCTRDRSCGTGTAVVALRLLH